MEEALEIHIGVPLIELMFTKPSMDRIKCHETGKRTQGRCTLSSFQSSPRAGRHYISTPQEKCHHSIPGTSSETDRWLCLCSVAKPQNNGHSRPPIMKLKKKL